MNYVSICDVISEPFLNPIMLQVVAWLFMFKYVLMTDDYFILYKGINIRTQEKHCLSNVLVHRIDSCTSGIITV